MDLTMLFSTLGCWMSAASHPAIGFSAVLLSLISTTVTN
jgi:hypothetical protein